MLLLEKHNTEGQRHRGTETQREMRIFSLVCEHAKAWGPIRKNSVAHLARQAVRSDNHVPGRYTRNPACVKTQTYGSSGCGRFGDGLVVALAQPESTRS